MQRVSLKFADRLRHALVGRPEARLVFMGNFEVEEYWARPETRLPGAAVKSSRSVVNRMEEFSLCLAGPDDHVLLKAGVDPGFARHLAASGLDSPRALHVDRNHPERTVTEDALDSPVLLEQLRALARRDDTFLVPLGASEPEEQLAEATGLPLAVPGAAVFRRVNSKIYSRRLAAELGLRRIPGQEILDVADFAALDPALAGVLAEGGRLAVKEALGVSGKGIAVLDRPRRLEQLVAMLTRRAGRIGDTTLELVVERWIDKACDLNYQFVVGLDGTVTFDFVKEALTANGVHKGHLMPARLEADQVEEVRDAASAIGAALYRDGYRGVVGVDAILDRDGRLYPMLEINARFNMSTYQTDIAERWLRGDAAAVARHCPLRLRRPLGFDELAEWLGDQLFDADRGSGLLVTNFAAVNAAWTGGGPFDGRLYGLFIAESLERVRELETAVGDRLRGLMEAR